MASREIVDYARNFAVMVRVQGPDPKGLKMRKHAFHQYHSGWTTLSASGMLLPETLYDTEVAKHLGNHKDRFGSLVVTLSSIFEPFMPQRNRDAVHQGNVELIPGVQIDIMVEDDLCLERDSKVGNGGASRWHAALLLASFDIPTSAAALQSVVNSSLDSTHHGWEIGWSLASHANSPPHFRGAPQSQSNLDMERSTSIGDLTIRIAILGVSSLSKDMPNITRSPSKERGAFLLAIGSPFGVLSPVHFFNSISVGSIANCYPPNSSSKSLLMADIRCLPGMEGSPVFDENACLVGVLFRPLRHNISGAEIQLLIPWEAIEPACSDLLLRTHSVGKRINSDKVKTDALRDMSMIKEHKSDGSFSCIREHPSSSCPFPSKVEKAMASICLVTVDEGIWASGVLLNSQGLILTNAHLIEPWRFGKTKLRGGRSIENAQLLQALTEKSVSSMHNGAFGNKKSENLLPDTSKSVNNLLQNKHKEYRLSFVSNGYRNLRVRLDRTEPWIWGDAKVVYVSKGPLDVALLQLEQIPEQLSPILMDCSWPSPGSKSYVIGHGLLGPKCGLSPSVCSGVVAKVVKAKIPASYHQGDSAEFFPAMLETTSAVHPGGSGGAVVNSEGHMIGLVTSNARHGGGTIIPHLNFSIPSAALAPIIKFSNDMDNLSVLQILDEPDEGLASVWALMPPLSPKPPDLPQFLVEEDDHNKEGKGSRFAKFMAERREVFRKPTVHKEGEEISCEIIPSKL